MRVSEGLGFDLDEPFNAYCASHEARSVVLGDTSVLIAKCPMSFYIPSSRPKLFPIEFWIAMLEAQELHFLLPDPPEAARRLKSAN